MITAAGFLFTPIPGSAEILLGTVVSVDREQQQIVLQVEAENDRQREITVQATGALPACTVAGTTMRVWGAFESEKKIFFTATDFRGPGGWSGHDPTGVHSRLHRYTSGRKQRLSNRPHRRRSRHGH